MRVAREVPMIEQVIRYLTSRQVPFRMHNYPMPEPQPHVAPQHVPFGRLVDTHVVLAGGRAVLAVVPAGAPLDIVSLGQELGTAVSEGSADDLPAPFKGMRAVPPLGGMMGIPLVIEARVSPGALVFRTFVDEHNESFVEVILDDLARIERPRSATFAIAGALPPATDDNGPRVFVIMGDAPGEPATGGRASKGKAGAERARSTRRKAAAESPRSGARAAGDKKASPRGRRGSRAHA